MTNELENVKIIPKPDSISWHEITKLLHFAFKEKQEKGLNYLAINQSVEKTKKRVKDGICLVALLNDELIGTMTLKFNEKEKLNQKKWYIKNKLATAHQQAVVPKFKGHGIGKKLRTECIKICERENIDILLCTTSIKAKRIQNSWRKIGAQLVEMKSYPTTNYYSVVMRLPIKGKKINPIIVKVRYFFSALKCKLLKNKNGKYHFLWRIAFNK